MTHIPSEKKSNIRVQARISLCALFIALALIFSYIEMLLPALPAAPGMKIGLANLIILIALCYLGPADAIFVDVLRVVLSGLLFTGFTMMIYSLAGAVLSLILMIALKKTGAFGMIGISIGGAAAHNIGQLFVASLMIENAGMMIYLPVLMISAVVSGSVIGFLAHILLSRVRKLRIHSVLFLPLLFAFTIAASSVGLSSCAAAEQLGGGIFGGGEDKIPDPVSKTAFLLDTTCTVTLFDPADESLADEALSLCADYEKMFSTTIEGSDVDRINKAGGDVVAVRPETIEMIEKSVEFSANTNGLFDITIGPVSSLWPFGSRINDEDRIVPDAAAIEALLPAVDYRGIEIEGDTVQLTNPEAAIDLGAIAKGYIADQMAEFLRSKNVKGAIINLGGNVVTVGEKPDGEPWKVGAENPGLAWDSRSVIGTFSITGSKSVVTSGIYQRQFESEGFTYHHILDPKTGFPAKTDLASATIITEQSIDGEGFSTSAILLGKDKAYQFLTLHGVQAILVTKDGQIVKTPGTDFTESTEEEGSAAETGSAGSKATRVVLEPTVFSDIEIAENLVDLGENPRPGFGLENFLGVTIHNTSEDGAGWGAEYLGNMLHTDWHDATKSWHYSVDDILIVQSIPEDEVAWHAGDGRDGNGNSRTIAIEICDNADSDILIATDRAAALTAKILKEHGIGKAVNSETIFQHNYWSLNDKDCPREIRHGIPYDWDEFIRRVNIYMARMY